MSSRPVDFLGLPKEEKSSSMKRSEYKLGGSGVFVSAISVERTRRILPYVDISALEDLNEKVRSFSIKICRAYSFFEWNWSSERHELHA